MHSDSDDGELSSLVGDAAVVRRVFDEMAVIVLAIAGGDLRISVANSAFRALVGRSSLIGLPLREAFADLAGQQVVEMHERVYATGEPLSQRGFRGQLEPEGGERFEVFFDFDLMPTRGSDGAVTGIIGVVRDVTAGARETRDAQRRAARAEQRYAEARDVITTLQEELLPSGVPVLPRVRIAASHLLADADTAAGGDWFDAVALPDGRVGLVVGDVVGHGVSASAVMGQLRVLLHERLVTTGDITTSLRALHAAATRVPGAHAATVCVALLNPTTGVVEYCTAGRPPPLLLPAGAEARYLPPTGAAPLGVGEGRFGTARDRLDDADMLLLYTDGILERPWRDLAGATVELAAAATDIAADRALREPYSVPVERVTTQALELLTRVSGYTDDITLNPSCTAQRGHSSGPLLLSGRRPRGAARRVEGSGVSGARPASVRRVMSR
ncbi:SpoIIE family protein phosphatase [Actinokineospora auranticolor]|uniref:PAS domain-containing protein n=1 Tax=Actinokineospora auranticolor TaxID=155976 RepID=A0A2S6GLI6_9PSEU|nr:SpoIIE family protein phosphatase [Actinokineospora auranticolor]PPK66098.1 PAS domain-containing protein [Actinokineospora auranticolor]